MARRKSGVVQAWVELLTDDPEAVSALEVARRRLGAARDLERLRRWRVIELGGSLPGRSTLAGLLHCSTRFYNPHKERCVLRTRLVDRAPLEPGEHLVLVAERDGERRPEAERWWLHETGRTIEVREAVGWVLHFGRACADPAAAAAELATARDRGDGLFCNPHSQLARVSGSRVPARLLTPEPPEPRAEEES